MTVDAVFSPPGIDHVSKWLVGSEPSATSFKAGEEVSATLYVRSIGKTETSASEWFDGLFLSRDMAYDADTDMELAPPVRYEVPSTFPGEYEVAFIDVQIPDVAPGVYYILGVTDESDDVSEVNNNNNTVATEIVVFDANLAQ